MLFVLLIFIHSLIVSLGDESISLRDVAALRLQQLKGELIDWLIQSSPQYQLAQSSSIEIIRRELKLPIAGDIALVPHTDQYLITERFNYNIRVYDNHELVNRINVEVGDRELFPFGYHFGLWDVAFDPDYNGTTNTTIYISMGLASPDLLGPELQRVGHHAIIKAQYNPDTYEINNLQGGELRTPTNFCLECRNQPKSTNPLPLTSFALADAPRLPETSILFESTRDPSHFADREHLSNVVRFKEHSSAGKILFLPDKTLLFSIGYIHQRLVSQDLTLYDGKIIRMTRDGVPVCDIEGAIDNPFCDSDHPVTRYIYSYGHKNNQGLAYDSANDRIFASEHGERGGDEINIIFPGENYGFPYFSSGSTPYIGEPRDILYPSEGLIKRNETVPPLFVWNYEAVSTAPTGIVWYTYPNSFQNTLLVAKLVGQGVDRIAIDSNGNPLFIESIITGYRFRDVEVDSDGILYLLAYYPPTLFIAEVVD